MQGASQVQVEIGQGKKRRETGGKRDGEGKEPEEMAQGGNRPH